MVSLEFERVYNNYSAMIFRLCYVRLGNKSDAEDVAADVFVRVMTNAPPFETEEHVKAWLIRVAINSCNDLSRRRYVRQTVNMDDIAEMGVSDEYHAEILLDMFTLSEKLRDVMYLRYYLDYPIEKIAEILKISPSAAASRLSRARREMRVEIEEKELDIYE